MQTRSILHIHIHRRLSRHVALFVYLRPKKSNEVERYYVGQCNKDAAGVKWARNAQP